MNSVWGTIETILATSVVMVLGYWAQHYWTGKREIRDARRKDRESIVSPIREALTEIQTKLEMRSMWEFATKGNEHRPYYSLLDRASLEKFKEVIV